MPEHDITRQLGYIQQSLSQNKKQLGFFIGAGCPLSIRVNEREDAGKKITDPLIPDVAGLTSKINNKLTSTDKKNPSSWDKVVELIKEDGSDHNNIELILSQVRLLRSVAGKGTARELKADELAKLDKDICVVISDEVDKPIPSKNSPYHNLAIWARSIKREYPVHIFTTNYDLLLEQAFEESSAPYFDGFVGARKAFFDLGAVEDERLLPSRWSRIWKIHGSLNWRLENGKDVVRSDQLSDKQSHLIYPSHLKYDQSRKMPYLAMLDRLKDFLLKPSAILFISGYSFSDEHINDIICRTLETNPTAHVFAFLFGSISAPQYGKAKQCAVSTPNLSVLAFDKGIIGRIEGDWNRSEEGHMTSILSKDIIVVTEPAKILELRLGDFLQLGNLLKNLTIGSHSDAEQ